MGIEDSIELREFRELERAFREAKWRPRFAETDGFVKKKMRAVKDERELFGHARRPGHHRCGVRAYR